MKFDKMIHSPGKMVLLIMICLMAMSSHSFAQAGDSEWKFGFGTGLFRLHIEGEAGFTTAIAGAQKFDVDLDPDDVSDLMETAFGIGGYATNGKLLIDYSISYLKLEDKTSSQDGVVTQAKLEYEASGAEVMIGYPVYKSSRGIIRLHGGLRYTKHDISSDMIIFGTPSGKDLTHEWVDGLIGVSAVMPLGETITWNNRLNAGFGGSDGTYQAYSGLTWKFHKHWSATLFGKYTAVDFEDGNPGDKDWYLYDVDEYGLGLNILFHW